MSNVPQPRPPADGNGPVPAVRDEALSFQLPAIRVTDLYAALLADARCENSRLGRAYDVEILRGFLGTPDRPAACALFVSRGRGTANALALAFRQAELARGMAPGTVNRRNATLRRLVKLARRYDLVEWSVEIDDLPVTIMPDMRGPGLEGWKALLAAAVARGDGPRARRDLAIILLLHDSALRRGEVAGLDVADVSLDRPAVHVAGKGKGGLKVWLTVSEATRSALAGWLDARGTTPGALFTKLLSPTVPWCYAGLAPLVWDMRVEALPDGAIAGRLNAAGHPTRSGVPWSGAAVGRTFPRAVAYADLFSAVAGWRAEGLKAAAIAARLNGMGRTTASGLPWDGVRVSGCFPPRPDPARRPDDRILPIHLNHMLSALSAAAGLDVPTRPHGLRHQAITRALDLTGGDVRKVQRFARHADPKTTIRYDDDRKDLAGVVTRLLSSDDD